MPSSTSNHFSRHFPPANSVLEEIISHVDYLHTFFFCVVGSNRQEHRPGSPGCGHQVFVCTRHPNRGILRVAKKCFRNVSLIMCQMSNMVNSIHMSDKLYVDYVTAVVVSFAKDICLVPHRRFAEQHRAKFRMPGGYLQNKRVEGISATHFALTVGSTRLWASYSSARAREV